MNRWLKWTLTAVGVFVLLLAAAAFLLPRLVDGEAIKNGITQELARHTGRDIRIEGPLELTVFPMLAVEVNGLILGNAEGFGEQPLVTIARARIGVGLLPLLRRQLRAEEVVLDGLQANLAVNGRGANNWGGLSSADTPGRGRDRDTGGPLTLQYIAGVNVTDASIEFRDERSGSHYRLSGFTLQTGALGENGPVPVDLSMRLEDLKASMSLEVGLSANAAHDAAAGTYTLADAELRLATGGEPLRLAAPALIFDAGRDSLSIGQFSAELAGLAASGAFEAQHLSASPRFSGRIEVPEFSPATVTRAMGMAPVHTTDTKVFSAMSLASSFAGDDTRITLPDLVMRLDDSRIDGKLTVTPQASGPPALRFSFAIDQLDLDRYLPPASEDAGSETQDVDVPAGGLAGLDVEGAVRAGRLIALGVEFSEAEAGLRIKDGVLRVQPLRGGFYGGRYVGDITLDTAGRVPKLTLNEKVESILFTQLAADLLGYDQVSGTAYGSLRATGSGATRSALLRDLDGSLELRLDEGALEGIDVWYEIRKAVARVKGQPTPEGDQGRTVFSRLMLDATVGGGAVRLDRLRGELPYLQIRGDGVIDLETLGLDVGLVAGVRNSPELAKDPLAADLAGREVPFRITGPAAQPGISVDVEKLLKAEATRALTDKLGELLGGKKDEDTDGSR